MSCEGNRDEELDTDLCKVEVCFEDYSIRQGDAELLFDPALVLGYCSAQHVWSGRKLINDSGRASPHTTTLVGWQRIGKLEFQATWHIGLVRGGTRRSVPRHGLLISYYLHTARLVPSREVALGGGTSSPVRGNESEGKAVQWRPHAVAEIEVS
jgi:hypothetical protein